MISKGPIATPLVLNAYLCIVKINDICTNYIRFSALFYAQNVFAFAAGALPRPR